MVPFIIKRGYTEVAVKIGKILWLPRFSLSTNHWPVGASASKAEEETGISFGLVGLGQGDPRAPSGFPGKAHLDKDSGWCCALCTGFFLELQAGEAPEGSLLNTCRYRSPMGRISLLLAESAQIQAQIVGSPTLQASAFQCRGI